MFIWSLEPESDGLAKTWRHLPSPACNAVAHEQEKNAGIRGWGANTLYATLDVGCHTPRHDQNSTMLVCDLFCACWRTSTWCATCRSYHTACLLPW